MICQTKNLLLNIVLQIQFYFYLYLPGDKTTNSGYFKRDRYLQKGSGIAKIIKKLNN